MNLILSETNWSNERLVFKCHLEQQTVKIWFLFVLIGGVFVTFCIKEFKSFEDFIVYPSLSLSPPPLSLSLSLCSLCLCLLSAIFVYLFLFIFSSYLRVFVSLHFLFIFLSICNSVCLSFYRSICLSMSNLIWYIYSLMNYRMW